MSDFRRSAPVRSYARIALSIGVAALATQLVGCGKKAAVDEELAAKLIQFAASRGCVLDFNHIYGDRPLPMWIAVAPEDAGSALAQQVVRQVSAEREAVNG